MFQLYKYVLLCLGGYDNNRGPMGGRGGWRGGYDNRMGGRPPFRGGGGGMGGGGYGGGGSFGRNFGGNQRSGGFRDGGRGRNNFFQPRGLFRSKTSSN